MSDFVGDDTKLGFYAIGNHWRVLSKLWPDLIYKIPLVLDAERVRHKSRSRELGKSGAVVPEE